MPQALRFTLACCLLVAVAMFLTGCAVTPHPDTPKPPAHVDMPVATLCVTKDQIQPEPALAKLSGDARRDAQALAATDLRLRVWGRKLAALVQGCLG